MSDKRLPVGKHLPYTIEDRNGINVLVSATGCRPATEAEVYFAQRCRKLEQRIRCLQEV